MKMEIGKDEVVLTTGEYRTLLAHVLTLRRELKFLHDHDGECPGDHPDWMRRIKALLGETAVHEYDPAAST